MIGSVRTVAMAYLRGDLLDHRRPDPSRGYNPRSAVLDAPNLLADSPFLEGAPCPFWRAPGANCWAGGRSKGYE